MWKPGLEAFLERWSEILTAFVLGFLQLRDITDARDPHRISTVIRAFPHLVRILTLWLSFEFESLICAFSDFDSTCAIVGGVLTIFQIIDSTIFAGKKRLIGGGEATGYGGMQGKML